MNYKKLFPFTAILFLIAVLLASASCGASAKGILAYQSQEMHLDITYEAGGMQMTAALTLAAGGIDRDMTLAVLSPEEAAGITFTRRGNHLTASDGTHTLPLTDLASATAPLAFFTIPESATVTDIQRTEAGRTVTLQSDGVVWQLCFSPNGHIPYHIDRTEGDRYREIEILGVRER